MNKKNIIVFCPNPYSLYTTSVCELLLRKGYHIECIVVRKFTIKRFRKEFSRDGIRLIKKIWNKLFLKEKAYSSELNSIVSFRKENNLVIKNINEFKKNATKIIKCNSLNDNNVELLLKSYDEKLIIFTGGGIIRKNILDNSGDGIINCHMGILPRYKGMDLPEWCILENEIEELGITMHFMDTGIDTGDILRKIKIPLGEHKSIKSLRASFEPVMASSMVSLVDDYLKGKVKQQQQPLSTRRQYFMIHEGLYKIARNKIKNYR
jgi:folate-dependent phosphoribosylglycinamide formyltransferase PurN